ncbi:uncharacterized protein [Triticum aestivum]|uniref:uncharacterized protein isoform X3 n=1 Tax=Triticum aestivum TaxID=4565 RepID=UPI001D01E7D0|nr:uncharacterized protein LOC123049212 isoform X3 [Triticum aestivum]
MVLPELEDNTETSWASEAEKAQREGESRRQTRSSSGELVAGLSNIPSARKRRTEESPPSSTDSIGTQLPPFTINQGVQAKNRKIVESSATPTVNESQDLQQGHGAANTSTSWTKIPAKDEPVCEDKGKAKLELPGFDNMTSEELQHEFLTRLSESRDIEANIVNMLKKKHEIKAESSMQSTVEELEKVKAAFDKERAAFETQKSVLKDN